MISKDERKSIGVSALASIIGMCGILAPVGWYVIKPTLVAAVSTAMAEDIQSSIEHKLEPLNAGFKAIILQNINSKRRLIAAMEFRRDTGDMWTAADATQLAQLQIELDGQIAAYQAIVAAE